MNEEKKRITLTEDAIQNMDGKQIMSQALLDAVYAIEDEIQREITLEQLRERAKDLHKATAFKKICSLYARKLGRNQAQTEPVGNTTAYSDAPIDPQSCGNWIADDAGVRIDTERGVMYACPHPICITARQNNQDDDGTERIQIAFRRSGRWSYVTVDKSITASLSKITTLADKGILVNSDNARYLVRFLGELEALNDDTIPRIRTTSHFGWDKSGGFLPYESELQFDAEDRFRGITAALQPAGTYEAWLETARQARTESMEARFAIASSLSSILVQPLGVLPFITNIYGLTSSGKTVVMQLAASVWADPAEALYIGDYQMTTAALETRADVLRSLPTIIDDHAKRSKELQRPGAMENLIYTLTGGKGKSRSTIKLGQARERTWCNAVLTCGERPMHSYCGQGGGIARILDIPCGDVIFKEPRKISNAAKRNHGYAGRAFLEAVQAIDRDELLNRYDALTEQLERIPDTNSKQINSAACLLLADQIATESIFQDNNALTVNDIAEILTSAAEIDDRQRCHEYILDQIDMHTVNFYIPKTAISAPQEPRGESWGKITHDGKVHLIKQKLKELCAKGGFSYDQYTKWLVKNGKAEMVNQRRISSDPAEKKYPCVVFYPETETAEIEPEVVQTLNDEFGDIKYD